MSIHECAELSLHHCGRSVEGGAQQSGNTKSPVDEERKTAGA